MKLLRDESLRVRVPSVLCPSRLQTPRDRPSHPWQKPRDMGFLVVYGSPVRGKGKDGKSYGIGVLNYVSRPASCRESSFLWLVLSRLVTHSLCFIVHE